MGVTQLVEASKHDVKRFHLGLSTPEIIRCTGAGRGIDPQVLQLGREGHFGLSATRDRAQK
jgi:hypothetical protein